MLDRLFHYAPHVSHREVPPRILKRGGGVAISDRRSLSEASRQGIASPSTLQKNVSRGRND